MESNNTRMVEEMTMECGLSTVYALSLMSDIDFEEFLFGQALTLATGLALVVAAHSLLVIFN